MTATHEAFGERGRVMAQPRELYSSQSPATARVLIHAMHGSMDAGHAGRLVVRHLLDVLPSTRVATFEVDELMDYRSRRPPMTFDGASWSAYREPVLAIDLLDVEQGGPVLLLHGPEPDLRWEQFSSAVGEIVRTCGVQLTIGLNGIPMGVPHTRPTTVTAHATRPSLLADHRSLVGAVEVPGSAAALVEFRLGQAGHDAMGFAVNVPHYLAQSEYPEAAAELLRRVADVAELRLPLARLEVAAGENRREIDAQVEASEEVKAVVHALEEQFDAFERGREPEVGRNLLAADDVPSAEEIGEAFEQFLAGLEQDSPPEPGT